MRITGIPLLVAILLWPYQVAAANPSSTSSAALDIDGNFLAVHGGYGFFSFRDVPKIGDYLKLEGVSPVKLVGSGPNIDLAFELDRGRKQHNFRLSFRFFGRFFYDSGLSKHRRPDEDQRKELAFMYGYKSFMFRNVLIRDFDIGIGLQLGVAYLETVRHFDPDIRIRLVEGIFSPSFVLCGRYRPFRFLNFRMEFANGLNVGLARNHHNRLGTMPRLNAAFGWLTHLNMSIGYSISATVELGINFRRHDHFVFSLANPSLLTKHQFLVYARCRLGRSR